MKQQISLLLYFCAGRHEYFLRGNSWKWNTCWKELPAFKALHTCYHIVSRHSNDTTIPLAVRHLYLKIVLLVFLSAQIQLNMFSSYCYWSFVFLPLKMPVHSYCPFFYFDIKGKEKKWQVRGLNLDLHENLINNHLLLPPLCTVLFLLG